MMALIDTNVVVASFLVRRSDSPVSRVVRGMIEGRFPYLLSVELLSEYRSVLLRSPIRQRHALAGEDVDLLLEEIAFLGIVRELNSACQGAPDPGDDHLWRLLKSQPGSLLVTGDHKLLGSPPDFASVFSPAAFCERMGF